MAVPKKKTSKARRDKRRATHRLEAPRVNLCPQCGNPKQPHRMCPICKTYNGREVEPLQHPGPVAVARIAVDAMGGDRAPEEVVAGAARGAERHDRADPLRPARARHRRSRARRGARRDRDGRRSPPRPSARSRTARSSSRAAPSARARPTPSSRPGTPARCSPPGLLEIRRLPGVLPAGDRRRRSRRATGPSVLIDAGANADCAARAPAPVRAHGLGLRRGDPRAWRAPRCGCSRSARSRRRATSSPSRRTRCSRRATAQLRGERRGPRPARARRRRRRHATASRATSR